MHKHACGPHIVVLVPIYLFTYLHTGQVPDRQLWCYIIVLTRCVEQRYAITITYTGEHLERYTVSVLSVSPRAFWEYLVFITILRLVG